MSEDGTTDNQHITGSLDKLFDQVAWWADATKQKREKDGIPKGGR